MSKLAQLASRLPTLSFKPPSEFGNHHPGFHSDNLGAGMMVAPTSTSAISDLLQQCNQMCISVVPQGGLTGLSGGATTDDDQLIVSTKGLSNIISIDSLGGVAVVESGVTLGQLETEANKHALSCGIDLAARDSATIGGMVATNAGGIEAFRNGLMRHRVLGLEVVLADGRVMRDLKKVTKANEGYDIKQLFIGAEGTLGIITRISLSLTPTKNTFRTALVSCKNTTQALSLFRRLHNHHELNLLSIEAMWPDYVHTVAKAVSLENLLKFEPDENAIFVLVEFSEAENTQSPFELLLMDMTESHAANNVIVAKNHKERDEMWRIREDSFTVDDVYPHGYWFDMSVPLEHMASYVDRLSRELQEIHGDLRLFL